MKEKCTDNRLPCIDCITLPHCLAIFKTNDQSSILFLRPLVSKCSLLVDYIIDRESDDLSFRTVSVLNVYDYFYQLSNEIRKE